MTLPPIPPPGEAAGQRKRRLKYFGSWGGRGGAGSSAGKKEIKPKTNQITLTH